MPDTIELAATIRRVLSEDAGVELTDEAAWLVEDVLFDALVDIPDAWWHAQCEDAEMVDAVNVAEAEEW